MTMVTDTPSCLRFLCRKSAGENELATHCYLSPQAKKKRKKIRTEVLHFFDILKCQERETSEGGKERG